MSLSDDGLTLAVGAPNDEGIGPGVNGDQTPTGTGSGACFVYVRASKSSPWSQQAVKCSTFLHPSSSALLIHLYLYCSNVFEVSQVKYRWPSERKVFWKLCFSKCGWKLPRCWSIRLDR